MWHEISQFEISDRYLRASNSRPRASIWTDIGEAKITQTIFGKAKVNVIREQDKKRRARLLTALVVMAIAAAAWQGWIAYQRMLSAPPPLSLSERIRVSAPVFQPENITLTPVAVGSQSGTPPQTGINSLMTSAKGAPQLAPGLTATGQKAAQPVTPQPLIASKPLTAPLATSNNASKNQTAMQQPPKLSAPIPSVAPAVAPLAEPVIKGDTSSLSPAGGNLPPETVNLQP